MEAGCRFATTAVEIRFLVRDSGIPHTHTHTHTGVIAKVAKWK